MTKTKRPKTKHHPFIEGLFVIPRVLDDDDSSMWKTLGFCTSLGILYAFSNFIDWVMA